jgi:hypothetical protein
METVIIQVGIVNQRGGNKFICPTIKRIQCVLDETELSTARIDVGSYTVDAFFFALHRLQYHKLLEIFNSLESI